MTSIRVVTEVDIEVNEVLDQVSTKDRIEELRDRNDASQELNEWTEEHYQLPENLYYALRDGNKENAIKIVNPLLDEKLGRQV